MADNIVTVPCLMNPPERKRGHGKGRSVGAAKVLAMQHPGQWVCAKVRPGRKRGSGMLDSAAEWHVAIRWQDGTPFGVNEEVTVTYIRFNPEEASRG